MPDQTTTSQPVKTVVVKPAAELPPRPEDEQLSGEGLAALDLFARLQRPVSVEKFPGTIVLRKFHRGQVICRQGQRGGSAFYILTTADLLRLRQIQLRELRKTGSRSPDVERLNSDIEQLQRRAQLLQGEPDDREACRVATAHLLGSSMGRPGVHGGFLSRIARGISRRTAPLASPRTIPNDGPTDIDFSTRQAPMYEGDVFGEMSCMTLAPRSATVVADRECYLVEFLRNIFDQFQRDAGYRQRIDELYKQRVLGNHLRRLEFLQDLTDEQLAALRRGVHLEIIDPGTVICDEGDTSDSVYVVRSGIVQAVKGVSVAVRADDVSSWQDLCRQLLQGASVPGAKHSSGPPQAESQASATTPAAKAAGKKPDVAAMLAAAKAKTAPAASPRQALWTRLSADEQSLVRRAQDAEPTGVEKQRMLELLNRLIQDRTLWASKAMEPVLQLPEVGESIRSFPKGAKGVAKDWTELEVRVCGRLAMQTLFHDAIRRRSGTGGPPRILAYFARGDCFGEMATVLNQPRLATCIAYDHPPDDPNRRPGRVELVRIDADAFHQLLDASPPLKAKVERLVAERQQEHAETTRQMPWESHAPTMSPEFRDQGLIQGQSLLLVDLDRCTRCGDCVRACINTHDDGYTRLFLDGPRFDRFLVPSACRKCLNPSCMIGCPVGSIQRGDNGQIEIRDWCIGCGLCARQCPYDSIQMHDIGVIPAVAAGWQFAPGSAVGDTDWQSRSRARGWLPGITPFHWNIDLHSDLASAAKNPWPAGNGELREPIHFRHSFQVPRQQLAAHRQFRLLAQSADLRLEVWLNGHSVELQQDAKQKRTGEAEARIDAGLLRAGSNLVAARVSPPTPADGFSPPYDSVVFSLRLDPVPEAAHAASPAGDSILTEVELVTARAVVCDLCSSLPGMQPACVTHCPHHAAMRVDGMSEW